MERINLGIDNLETGKDKPIDLGSHIVLRAPPGGERTSAVVSFVREGLERGESVVAVIAMPYEDFLSRLEGVGLNPKEALDEGRLHIVDWERFHRETVRGVEEIDGVLAASVDLANVRMALGMALDAITYGTKRILLDIMDSATTLYFKEELEEHIAPMISRFEDSTGLFVISDSSESEGIVASFAHMFDGVLLIESGPTGSTISLMALSEKVASISGKKVYLGDTGLVAQRAGLVCTICGSWVQSEDPGCAECGADFSVNPPEKVLQKMESGYTENLFLCPGCGAFLADDADRCDICGTEFLGEDTEGESAYFLDEIEEELEHDLQAPEEALFADIPEKTS